MMKPTIRHAITKCGLLVVSSLLLSGCFDLNFPDVQTYYKTFNSSLNTIKTDEKGLTSSTNDYSIQEYIFNDDTVNNLDKAKTLDSDYYEYLSVKTANEMLLSDCAIYIKCKENENLTLRAFILDKLPEVKDVRAFNRPKIDPQTHKEASYSDKFENPCLEKTVSLVKDVWNSVYFGSWIVDKKPSATVKIKKDQYFLFQILNNTGYGADLELKPFKFTFANVMISPAKGEGK